MVKVINWALQQIVEIIELLVGLLPQSPFVGLEPHFAALQSYLGYIAYFVPVDVMLSITATWLGAVAVWYTVQWLARVVRMV